MVHRGAHGAPSEAVAILTAWLAENFDLIDGRLGSEGTDPFSYPGGARRLYNRLKAMLFEAVFKDKDREELRRLLDWPDVTAERVEREAWDEAQRSLANMGIELDWEHFPGPEIPGDADPVVDTDGVQEPA